MAIKTLELWRKEFNLDNPFQRREAGGIGYLVAERAYEGRLSSMLMDGETPHGWRPEIDGRSAEAKELAAAEKAMFEAINRYDNARLAAKAKAKK